MKLKQLSKEIESLRRKNSVLMRKNCEMKKDLTESKKNSLSLFRSNETVKMFIDPCSGAIIDSNQACFRFYGYSRDDFLKMHLSEISLFPEKQLRNDLFRAKKGWLHELKDKHRLANGEMRDVALKVSPVQYNRKSIIFVVVEDRSQLKRAEDLLSYQIEQQQLMPDYVRSEVVLRSKSCELGALLNNIQVQIWCLQDEGTYGQVNAAHAAFLGYERHQVEYQSLHVVFSRERARQNIAKNREIFAQKSRKSYEQWSENGQGQERLLRFIKTPLFDADGNVEFVVCSAEDITKQKLAEEALHKTNRLLKIKSNQDGLTGISNRRCFEEAFSREWRRCKRSALQIALVLVDIDHFKAFNDQYGHQAGDKCLKQVACALKQSVHRSADFVARYGGEEFAILLPETGLEGAVNVAEKARMNVASLQIPHKFGNPEEVVTVSVGAAVTLPGTGVGGSSGYSFLAAVDRALYRAKDKGRNRIECVGLDANSGLNVNRGSDPQIPCEQVPLAG
ncbi:MAG: diguanylate cyclase [Desulfohalobiaceae bacterium]|nr:diguanylate cyclase [Desulfohalobiaceae bacterium]